MDFASLVAPFTSRLDQLWASFVAWNVDGGRAPLWFLVVAALVGAAVAAGPYWRLVRVAVTFFHELGHAVAGLMVGAKVDKITLNLNTSGVTHWTFPGNPGRLRTAWVAWWGYPAPSVVGGIGALCLLEGWGRAWAAASALTIALVLLFWVRNLWGALVCAVFGGLALLVVWQGALAGEVLAALLATFLVVGGLRTLLEHRREGSAPGSDSVVVSRQLRLPAGFVRVAMLSTGAALPAAMLLLPYVL